MDSAATSQALYTVIEDQHEFNLTHRANAHRSGHRMGSWVSNIYHQAKEDIGNWLGINDPQQRVVFTSGASQSLDDSVKIIASVYKRATIYIGVDFHHSLYLPLQKIASNNSFYSIKFINTTSEGYLDLEDLKAKMSADTGPKVIAVTAVSNVLGMVNDLEQIKSIAKIHSAVTIVDASQIVSKRKVDYTGFDFVAFSWHKVYGPTGLGCLILGDRWINYDPVRPGGGSVTQVTLESTQWTNDATRFESGTQNLSAIAAIPRLVNWLIKHSNDLERHDIEISKLASSHVEVGRFKAVTASESSLISLTPILASPEDYAYMLDASNVMVRTGKLCAEPLVSSYNLNGLIRLSWAAYTSSNDIETTFDKLGDAYARFQKHVR